MNTSPYERLLKTASGYTRSSVLVTAAELDCFTWIIVNGNNVSAPDLARGIEADPRATGVLLDALAATGFLRKNGIDPHASYSVPEEYLALLDRRHPETCIPMLRLMANGHRTWSQLTWSVKEGKPRERPVSILGPEEDRVSFILGMNTVAMRLVAPTMEALQEAGVLSFAALPPRILDVGGASGTYALALLETVPGCLVTIFDLPVGIGQAKKRFTGSEFEDRVGFVEGDFTQDALPQGFTFAWLSAIIHSFGREECVNLYRNIHQALDEGGTLAVRDYFMSPDRTSPPDGALFGVNMLLNTPSGRVHTFEETREDLERAGFTDIRLAVPAPSMSAVVTARKG